MVSLRANPEQKLKEDDFIIQEIDARNKDELLLFSDKANVYKIRVHDLEDHKASVLGEYLPNILELDEDEKIIYMVIAGEYEGYMLFAFENGKIAKIFMNSYATKTNRKKLINAYSKLSNLVKIMYLADDLDLVAYSDIGKVLVFSTSCINPKSARDSQGVQMLKEKKGSKMVDIKTLDQAKLSDVEYYRTKISRL